MNHWRSQRFVKEGLERGVGSEVLQNAVRVAQRLQSRSPDLPPLFTLGHLAHECRVPRAFLRSVVSRSAGDLYRVFKLKKRSIGLGNRYRYVCVPAPLLLRAQRWIHHQILLKTKPHEASYAFHPQGSIVECSGVHCKAQWLLKLDVTNFFESVQEQDVYTVFLGLGYQPLLSFEMARICTRVRNLKNPHRVVYLDDYSIAAYSDTRIGHLPQGAPTSPLLANLVARGLDDDFATLSSKYGFRYTRYADDLTFSTPDRTFSRSSALAFIHECYEVLRGRGFWPNRAKTQIIPPGARKIVLGLLVDGAAPRLTRAFRDNLRMHLYYLRRADVGPVVHARNRGFDSVLGLQHHLFGLAAFAKGVDSAWASDRIAELQSVNWPTPFIHFPP